MYVCMYVELAEHAKVASAAHRQADPSYQQPIDRLIHAILPAW